MVSAREAQAFLDELVAYDEAVVAGDEVQLRRRRTEKAWSQLFPRLFAALAALRVKHLRLELRTFAPAEDGPGSLLEVDELPSLEWLDLGLLYSRPEPRAFAAWFTTFKARHPLLQVKRESLWREAGTPRVTTVDFEGRRSEEPLQPGGGVMQLLCPQKPDDNPFDLPMLRVKHERGTGLLLDGMNLPADAVVRCNGRAVPLLEKRKSSSKGPIIRKELAPCMLVDGDCVEVGAVQFVVHEFDLASEREATRARLPASPGLDALRARRPSTEERIIGDWPFLSVPAGERRLLASMSQTGEVIEWLPDAGLDGLRAMMSLLDPAIPLSNGDANWLVKHFEGWEVLMGHPESVERWLLDDGVSRTNVFVGDSALRLTVGKRLHEPLTLKGELARIDVARRGDAKLGNHDTFEFVAPPLFQELIERFGPRGADALWRFRHFRRDRGVQANVGFTRVDVGPFTWLELEADDWLVSVTVVNDAAVEFSRRRKNGADSVWSCESMLITLLRSVNRDAVANDDVFTLLARLGLGEVLTTPTPVRTGSTLRFAMNGPDGVQDVVVDLAGPAARIEARNWKR